MTLDIYGSISKSWAYLSEILFFSLSVYRISEPILFYWLVLVNMQVAKGLLTYVSQEVKDLYNLVENEFHPLDLAAKVQPHMLRLSKLSDKLSSASPVPEVQLEQYVPALEKLTTLRVLQQVVLSYVVIYYHSMTSVGQNNAHILLSSSIDVSGGLCFKNGVNLLFCINQCPKVFLFVLNFVLSTGILSDGYSYVCLKCYSFRTLSFFFPLTEIVAMVCRCLKCIRR